MLDLDALAEGVRSYDPRVADLPAGVVVMQRTTALALIAEIRALRTALRPRQEFFEKCWEYARDARDVEGSDVQDWAYELGLLVKVTANAPCGEGCVCEEIADEFPTDCYRLAPIPDGVGAPERDLR